MFYRIKKKKKRILKVSFRLPAEKATTTPILAQVIGQFGFNIQEFLLLFNKKSNIFLEGIKTQTFLYILQNKK
jgi:ribosomal protein L11